MPWQRAFASPDARAPLGEYGARHAAPGRRATRARPLRHVPAIALAVAPDDHAAERVPTM